MLTFLPLVLAVALQSPFGASPRPEEPAAPPAVAPAATRISPLETSMMTVVDHAYLLGGEKVQLPAVRVDRVLSSRLVVVGHPRRLRVDGTYQAYWWDKLLVLVPSTSQLKEGMILSLAGTVRTVEGMRLSGGLAEMSEKQARDKARQPLFVADSVETPDGVVLR